LEDDGNGINIKWTYSPITSITGYLGSTIDGFVYLVDGGKVRKLDATNGTVIDSSQVNLLSGFLLKITVDADGKVIVCNAEAGGGKYYCFSSDLQTLLWEMNVPYNYYCGASLGKEGVMVITGSGTQIKAYKYSGTRKPVADFYTDTTSIFQGTGLNFYDRSSYQPNSWLWFFPGAETSSSTDQNPQNIIYNTPGIYEVSLIATNSFGSDTLINSCYIEVEQTTYAEDEIDLFDEFKLFQNYPNPFNPKTTISWQQPIESKVTIKIFDVLGKEIKTILDEEMNSGSNQIDFDGDWLPSGVYFYQITAGNFSQIRKMLLLH
jgi:PKD repeat protein